MRGYSRITKLHSVNALRGMSAYSWCHSVVSLVLDSKLIGMCTYVSRISKPEGGGRSDGLTALTVTAMMKGRGRGRGGRK